MPVRRRKVWIVIAALLLATCAPAVGPATAIASATIECVAPAATSDRALPSATPLPALPADAAFPAAGGDLMVFAAASLTDTFTRIGDELMAAHPGLDITFNFAGSSTLVTQLAEGAGADVLVTANQEQMTRAIAAGTIAAAPQVVAHNRLVIVVPADNPAEITSLADLGGDGVTLVLAAAGVPAGAYARAIVCAAAGDTATYGDGFAASVAGNIVSEEDNVRAALAKVQLGEADASIVYATDVGPLDASAVTVIELPAAISPIADYPIAPVVGGDATLGAGFIAWLLGPAGQAALVADGFLASA